MFCKYKNIFGKVNEGLHSFRIFDIAIIDVLLTFFTAFIIKKFNSKYNYYIILLLLFILGIFLHRIFCVKTTIDNFFFE